MWSKASNAFGWRCYLGRLCGTNDIPPYAAPARATDLAGLPEAYVCVGGADGFRDEDITYAMRLLQAGVSVELHSLPGTQTYTVLELIGSTMIFAIRSDPLRPRFVQFSPASVDL